MLSKPKVAWVFTDEGVPSMMHKWHNLSAYNTFAWDELCNPIGDEHADIHYLEGYRKTVVNSEEFDGESWDYFFKVESGWIEKTTYQSVIHIERAVRVTFEALPERLQYRIRLLRERKAEGKSEGEMNIFGGEE